MRYLLILSALLLPSPMPGQVTAAANSPEGVVAQVLLADSAGDWRTLIRLGHPQALRRIQSAQVWQLSIMHSPLFDSLRGSFPFDSGRIKGMMLAMRQREYQQLHEILGVGTVEELAALPAESVFARQYRSDGASRIRVYSQPQSVVARILGTVVSGDTLAIVVIAPRQDPLFDSLPARFLGAGSPPMSGRPDVMTLRRWQGEWKSMLDQPPSFPRGSTTLMPESK